MFLWNLFENIEEKNSILARVKLLWNRNHSSHWKREFYWLCPARIGIEFKIKWLNLRRVTQSIITRMHVDVDAGVDLCAITLANVISMLLPLPSVLPSLIRTIFLRPWKCIGSLAQHGFIFIVIVCHWSLQIKICFGKIIRISLMWRNIVVLPLNEHSDWARFLTMA